MPSWWIHPIFAFRAGIIDSPDPHGGVVADPDGLYGLTLTGHDDLRNDNGDQFRYVVRKGDKNQATLLRAILHPKPSIRVLRSHTLRSSFSPIAGIRYDGLYKITSYGVNLDPVDKTTIRYELSLQRETDDQPSLREIMKLPRAEEIDDYVEYKRLRDIRKKRISQGPHRHANKQDEVLGIIHALEMGKGAEDDEISITSVRLSQQPTTSLTSSLGPDPHRDQSLQWHLY